MTDEIPRCTAVSSQSGERCRNRPIRGGLVCSTHGGSAPQVRAAAAVRVVQAEVAREIGRQGWEPVTDPVGAYADNAGEVLAFKDRLRERVETLDDWTLRIAAFGASSEEGEGGQLMAMGEQVRAYVAAYERSLDRAERTLARMISLGFDAAALELRANEINRRAGKTFEDVVWRILGDLGLTSEQQAAAPAVVRERFREAAVGELEQGATA
jgi:hypothetical protein